MSLHKAPPLSTCNVKVAKCILPNFLFCVGFFFSCMKHVAACELHVLTDSNILICRVEIQGILFGLTCLLSCWDKDGGTPIQT